MTIRVEVNERDCQVESRNAQTKNGPQTFYHQTAYLHKRGLAYPDRIRVPVKSPAEAYMPGMYEVADCSFHAGRFGDLEVNRFEFALQPVAAAAEARKAS